MLHASHVSCRKLIMSTKFKSSRNGKKKTKKYPGKYNKGYKNTLYTAPKYRPEKKWSDEIAGIQTPIGSAFATTPVHVTEISQGTLGNNRIGNKIQMCSLLIRANVMTVGNFTSVVPGQCRIVVVYDRQPNGTIAARGDIFQDATLCGSPLMMNYSGRFQVLADEYTESPAAPFMAVTWQKFIKFNLPAVYPGSGTNPTTGSITVWVAANGDINDVTPAHFPTVQIITRLRFYDV